MTDPADINETVITLSKQGKPQNKYPSQPKDSNHPISKFAKEFYTNENMNEIMSGKIPEAFNGDEILASRQIKSLGFTAPIALGIANNLLNEAIETGNDLNAGLKKSYQI